MRFRSIVIAAAGCAVVALCIVGCAQRATEVSPIAPLPSPAIASSAPPSAESAPPALESARPALESEAKPLAPKDQGAPIVASRAEYSEGHAAGSSSAKRVPVSQAPSAKPGHTTETPVAGPAEGDSKATPATGPAWGPALPAAGGEHGAGGTKKPPNVICTPDGVCRIVN
jgi:hypothetical protein